MGSERVLDGEVLGLLRQVTGLRQRVPELPA